MSVQLSQIIDEKISQELTASNHFFGTPILVENIEQGRLYVFSTESDYRWTPTRRKLTQLVADQTAVAIANHRTNCRITL